MLKAVLTCLKGEVRYVALTKGWAPYKVITYKGRMYALTPSRTDGGWPVYREIPAG